MYFKNLSIDILLSHILSKIDMDTLCLISKISIYLNILILNNLNYILKHKSKLKILYAGKESPFFRKKPISNFNLNLFKESFLTYHSNPFLSANSITYTINSKFYVFDKELYCYDNTILTINKFNGNAMIRCNFKLPTVKNTYEKNPNYLFKTILHGDFSIKILAAKDNPISKHFPKKSKEFKYLYYNFDNDVLNNLHVEYLLKGIMENNNEYTVTINDKTGNFLSKYFNINLEFHSAKAREARWQKDLNTHTTCNNFNSKGGMY